MCDPVTTSLMIASAGASYAGNRKAQKAMEGTVAEESARQRRFRDQQKGVLDQSTASRASGKTQEEMALDAAKANTAADAAAAASTAGATDAPSGVAPSAAASQNVTDSYSRESGRAQAKSKEDSTRSAALNAFSNVMTAQQLNNSKYAQDSAVLANMSQGSLGVLPYELQAASKSGDGLKTLSQVLSLASIYSGYQAGIGKPLGPASWGELFNPEVAAAAPAAAPTFSTPDVPQYAATPAATSPSSLNVIGPPAPPATINHAYTTFPQSGIGPPNFNMPKAMQNGYINSTGQYVGGIKGINANLTQGIKVR
ncbi:hypothetical protein UFOVP477_46 [uncultured Caudovirales phage]|uniref:Uncharacterized protein n=1 Tax=uncultured Caudovirales phage TaxID=2100421 RepID=A0A6J5NVU6_9CAUD|nr:hypothetical protein UFOVP477_46 [uncultured Caudovirales phage]CAB4163133.1 hypothetical protein UFOVP798_3 [uncultured Caudovirales phage]CAB4191433.1 hypothetical protein UFOVP1222_29 [uncultured Caudovirales phage]